MVALRKPPPVHLTVAEFLVWDSGDHSGRLWQLRDGIPEAMAPASEAHGAIQSELSGLLREHLLRLGSPCRVVIAPGVVPHVQASDNVRIPDLAVTCVPPSREHLMSNPVLVIEILSPSNKDKTRSNVWAYTTIPSVREILVISGTEVRAELLRRAPDGAWPEAPTVIDHGQSMTLDSIGLELPLAAAYRTTPLA